MNAQGVATQAGKHWYKKLQGVALPDSRWGDNARTYRKEGGRTDYVKMRSGAEVQLRTWLHTEPAAYRRRRTHRCRRIFFCAVTREFIPSF